MKPIEYIPLDDPKGKGDDNNNNTEKKSNSLKFGLNTNCKFLSAEVDESEKSGEAFIKFYFEINGVKKYSQTFEVTEDTRIKHLNGLSEEEAREELLRERNRYIFYIFEQLGVEQKDIQSIIYTSAEHGYGFKDIMRHLIRCIPDEALVINFHIFLEYSWFLNKNRELDGENDCYRTYLQIPKKVSTKTLFLFDADVDNINGVEFKEEREWIDPSSGTKCNGLRYISSKGLLHVFERSEKFMRSRKAKQQFHEDGNFDRNKKPKGFAELQAKFETIKKNLPEVLKKYEESKEQ